MIDTIVMKVMQQVAGAQLVTVHDAEGTLQGNTLNTTCTASTCMLMEQTL